MGPEILVPLSFFAMIFGIVYLIYSTRNRERLALIEKGLMPVFFYRQKQMESHHGKSL